MDKILVIDDDGELCELLSDYLGREGFVVKSIHHGEQGAAEALAGDYALVVLDVMLPGLNGFDVLRRIRATSKLPVIMLTARGDDIDRIVGLELGADDYLPKPFNPRELVARVRAIQRRTEAATAANQVSAKIVRGDLVLCAATRTVTRGGEAVELTSVEFTLLEILLRQAGQVISRDELLKKALGRRLAAYDRSIDVHVSALRKKLGRQCGGHERIKTVRGVGYLYALQEGAG